MFEPREARRRGGFGEHSRPGGESRYRPQNRLVGDGHGPAPRFAQATQAQARGARRLHRQAVGHAVGSRDRLHVLRSGAPRASYRRRAYRLNGEQARQPVDQAGATQVGEPLRHARQDHPVPHRNDDDIGSLGSQSPGDLEPHRLLAFDGERVKSRVAVVPGEFPTRREAQLECLIVGSVHRQDLRAVRQHLDQLSLGRGRGDEHHGSQVGRRAHGRQSCPRVSRRGGRDRPETVFASLGRHEQRGPILGGAARVARVVLDPQPGHAELAPQGGGGHERGVAGRKRGEGVRRRDRQEGGEKTRVVRRLDRPSVGQGSQLHFEHTPSGSSRHLELAAQIAHETPRVFGVLACALGAPEDEVCLHRVTS